MANWSTLKAAIANVIKANDNQEITGQALQNTLNGIVNAIGENATFIGVAGPTTNPGVPDGNVFYFSSDFGVYSNFGGIEIKNEEFAVLLWKDATWKKILISVFATKSQIANMEKEINDFKNVVNNADEKANLAINMATEANDTSKGLNEKINGNINYEDFSEATKQIIEAAGGGIINNAPDDEDLEAITINGLSVIRQKTIKEYNPADNTGLGRKIIRKRVGNIITQADFDKENTVYEIRYDFDLNGQEITIPKKCILKFTEGSLKNGTINGSNTIIESPRYCIFRNDLHLKGSYLRSFYFEWFGATGNGIDDDAPYIQRALDIVFSNINKNPGSQIKIIGGHYFLNSQIVIRTMSQFANWIIEFESILGNYNGYLIELIGEISSCELIIGDICNEKGGCIRCISDINGDTWMGTSIIKSNRMRAHIDYDCIHLEAEKSVNKSWINDNTIDVGRFLNGRHGIYAKSCHQLLFMRTDFEYGDCYIEDCNGATFIAPHFADKGSSAYVMTTVGKCSNLNIIGGSCARMAFEASENLPAFNLSDGTNGTVISYQGNPDFKPGMELDGTSAFKIIKGKIFTLNSVGIFNANVGDLIYDTGNLKSGIGAPTYLGANTNTTEIILSDKYYGGLGKINEVIIAYSNKPLKISFSYNGIISELSNFKKDYAKVRYTWEYGNRWICEILDYKKHIIPTHGTIEEIKPFESSIEVGYKYLCTNIRDSNILVPIYYKGYGTWITSDGVTITNKYIGNYADKPISKYNQIGIAYYATDLDKMVFNANDKWIDADGENPESLRIGTWNYKPKNIKIGFQYFCIDKQTSEGGTDGIIIYHKGNNVWVDALGRIIT